MRITTLLFALLLLGTACSAEGLIENVANQALEEEGVSIDLDGDQITVEGPDGSVTAGAGLPADFPADFPLPGGAEAQGGASGAGSDVVATFRVDGSVADTVAFYESELPAAGYEISQSVGNGDSGHAFTISGNGWNGQVTVGNAGFTNVAVVLNRLE